MRALLDSDTFCKLAISGLLRESLRLLGTEVSECARLPALPYMLRRGQLRRLFGETACDAILPLAETIPVVPQPTNRWLDVLVPVSDIDPGEAQLLAAAAETTAVLISADKRALRAIKSVPDLPEALAGQIVTVEAVLLALCDFLGVDEVRRKVQALMAIDKVVRACFSPEDADPRKGLRSYQRSLTDEVSPLILWEPQQGGGK